MHKCQALIHCHMRPLPLKIPTSTNSHSRRGCWVPHGMSSPAYGYSAFREGPPVMSEHYWPSWFSDSSPVFRLFGFIPWVLVIYSIIHLINTHAKAREYKVTNTCPLLALRNSPSRGQALCCRGLHFTATSRNEKNIITSFSMTKFNFSPQHLAQCEIVTAE